VNLAAQKYEGDRFSTWFFQKLLEELSWWMNKQRLRNYEPCFFFTWALQPKLPPLMLCCSFCPIHPASPNSEAGQIAFFLNLACMLVVMKV